MAGSSFGKSFVVTTLGPQQRAESKNTHSLWITVVIHALWTDEIHSDLHSCGYCV